MSGVAKVVRFNWPTFAAASAIAVVGVALGTAWSYAIAAGAVVGMVNALGATYWAYDHSELYSRSWLKELSPQPRRVLRVHTGLDETGARLATLFPDAEHLACDIYDPRYATEPSIARARASGVEGALTAKADELPVNDAWADVALGFLALHEVRDATLRAKLFAELRRTVRTRGHLIIVEHLRNVPNFLVYGPGALHFLPRRAWIAAARAGFTLRNERAITPFIRVFAFEAA